MSTTKVNADVLDLADDYAFTGTVTGAGGGIIVQIVHTEFNAQVTGTTILPSDDTVPQNNEGVEFMTRAITPTNSSNILTIEVVIMLNSSIGASATGITLFQDSISSAISGMPATHAGTNFVENLKLTHEMVAGTTSSTTFKLRGGNAGSATVRMNGSGTRFYGDIPKSSMTITERLP